MTTTATFLSKYAKRYHAGAFATPTAGELKTMDVVDIGEEGARTVVVKKRISRVSRRTDFTGDRFEVPAGATLATHVARDDGAEIPTIDADYVMAYAEDRELSDQLRRSGRPVHASRITAAAEVINCWGPVGAEAKRYETWDLATVTRIPLTVPESQRESIVGEISSLVGWDDDFPYYSDGSWSSLSLRGFWTDDPARGVKPSEMPKSWKADHPGDLDRECDWTILANRVPALVSFVKGVGWMENLERLRLLQMSGRGGRGGKLGRHTDITDRDSGTRDGEIARFHVPLITDPAIHLHSWDLDGEHRETHLERWGCYYLDARKPHAVTNPTGVDRVHLVADVIVNQSVRDLISDAYLLS